MKLPPLRDRREDIPYLTAAFVRETAERVCRSRCSGLTPGAERLLAAAPWDGNVRELRNVIERACILADGDFITERELAISLPAAACRRPQPVVPVVGAAGVRPRATSAETDLLVNVERDHIQRALVRAAATRRRPPRCSASAAARCIAGSSGSTCRRPSPAAGTWP